MLDFAPVKNGEIKLIDFAAQFTLEDLKRFSSESVDTLLEILAGLDDADVTFDPIDEHADDPHAVAGEEHIGWSLAHLVVHATASSEEWAAYSSILARGIVYPAEPRLRYETSWHEVKTHAQCIQRLEESRRMRLGYLATWPDTPHLDIKRELSERFVERIGAINAPAALLFGLQHEHGHYAQMREVRRQALAAKQAAN